MDAYSRSEVVCALSGGYATSSSVGNIYSDYSTSSNLPMKSQSVTRTLTGYRNPYWRDQVKLGQNATTTMVATDYQFQPCYVDIDVDFEGYLPANPAFHQTYTYTYQGYVDPGPGIIGVVAVPSSIVTEVTNRCIRKFIASVNSARSSGNLTGRSIRHLNHDLHSVASFVPKISGSINGYLSQLTKIGRNTINKGRLLEDVRSAYLEFEFGLKPFSEDLTAVLVDFSRHRDVDVQPVSGSGLMTFSASKGTKSLANSNYGPNNLLGPAIPYSITSEYGVRYKGAVHTGRNANGQISWAQDNRMLPRDWLPTLVSILPYDWLVNYFVNVNDLIDGLCFVFSDLAWGCVTTRNVTTVVFGNAVFTGHAASNFAYPYTLLRDSSTISGGSSTHVFKQVTRSALSSSDLVPSLTFKVPTKPIQFVNMLASFLPRIRSVVNSFM